MKGIFIYLFIEAKPPVWNWFSLCYEVLSLHCENTFDLPDLYV